METLSANYLRPIVDARFENEVSLMARVLKPYKANCQYLKTAVIQKQGDPQDGGRILGSCTFGIHSSCYIDDTGHFNSVEFNICYNQMMYYTIAKSIKEGAMKAFGAWTMDAFWQKQLPDVLIVSFESTFRRPMQSQAFYGEIEFVRLRERKAEQPVLYVNTLCRYWDDTGGQCEGEVNLAIVNPPRSNGRVSSQP